MPTSRASTISKAAIPILMLERGWLLAKDIRKRMPQHIDCGLRHRFLVDVLKSDRCVERRRVWNGKQSLLAYRYNGLRCEVEG